jgi:hypothetical protein
MIPLQRRAGTATRDPLVDRLIAQRRPVRMLRFVPLVLVDLPVDVVVVLEQQEGAGETSRTERALRNG